MPDPRKNPAVQNLKEQMEAVPKQMAPQAKITVICQGFNMGIAETADGKMFVLNGQFPVGEVELVWALEHTPKLIEAMQALYDEATTGLTVPKGGLVVPKGAQDA